MKQREKHRKNGSHIESGNLSRTQKRRNYFVLPAAMLVIGIITGYFLSGVSGNSSAAITREQASEKAVAYINSALQGKAVAKMVSINESSGMYSMDIDVGGTKYNSFMTRDGKMLFPSGINLEQTVGQPANSGSANAIPKSDKPKAELFVMSFCPYGVQAEDIMKPVADLLGSKTEIKVRFISQVFNNEEEINAYADSLKRNNPSVTVEQIKATSLKLNNAYIISLHGAAEAKEDLRQLCMIKNYPDKYWNYLSSFNGNCYPIYKNDTALDSCWKSSASSAGIDSAKIDSCVNADSLALLKLDEQAAGAYGVSGSPTLIINGAAYGGARSSDGFKSAICSAFNNPPAECGQKIGTASQAASAAPSGGCG